MGRAPRRTSRVYFVGAGLSSAFGLPNTQQLLELVHTLSTGASYWGSRKRLGKRLESAYEAIYPLETHDAEAGFRPSVVDFFSVLSTYTELASGFPGASIEAPHELVRDLKRALAFILLRELKSNEASLVAGHPYLSELLQPGNFIVTSNWDLLLERFASAQNVPLRYRIGARPERQVTVLKLHGSVDWATQYSILTPKAGTPADEVHIDDLECRWPQADYAGQLPAPLGIWLGVGFRGGREPLSEGAGVRFQTLGASYIS